MAVINMCVAFSLVGRMARSEIALRSVAGTSLGQDMANAALYSSVRSK